jgi:hypothetical protein
MRINYLGGKRPLYLRRKKATAIDIGLWSSSQKRRADLQDPQEDPRAGICEASERDVQGVSKNKEMYLVEWSAPSETEEEPTSVTSNVSVRGAGNVSLGIILPRRSKETLDDAENLE